MGSFGNLFETPDTTPVGGLHLQHVGAIIRLTFPDQLGSFGKKP
jgi:hypothetical protein